MNIKHHSIKINPIKGAFTLTELLLVIVIMTAGFLLTGCGNKKAKPSPVALQPKIQPAQPAPAENTPTTEAEPSTQVEASAPVAVSPGSTNVNAAPDFATINYTIRGWVFQHGRMPTNFNEFAATCGLQISPPPPGKQYVFDAKLHVQLVNR